MMFGIEVCKRGDKVHPLSGINPADVGDNVVSHPDQLAMSAESGLGMSCNTCHTSLDTLRVPSETVHNSSPELHGGNGDAEAS